MGPVGKLAVSHTLGFRGLDPSSSGEGASLRDISDVWWLSPHLEAYSSTVAILDKWTCPASNSLLNLDMLFPSLPQAGGYALRAAGDLEERQKEEPLWALAHASGRVVFALGI